MSDLLNNERTNESHIQLFDDVILFLPYCSLVWLQGYLYSNLSMKRLFVLLSRKNKGITVDQVCRSQGASLIMKMLEAGGVQTHDCESCRSHGQGINPLF